MRIGFFLSSEEFDPRELDPHADGVLPRFHNHHHAAALSTATA